jgi:hypothetical protein
MVQLVDGSDVNGDVGGTASAVFMLEALGHERRDIAISGRNVERHRNAVGRPTADVALKNDLDRRRNASL